MRRSAASKVLVIAPALVAGAALLAGCEDGPNQSYSPASGTLFNNGATDGSVGPLEAGYDAGYNSTNALTPCSAEIKRSRWATMLSEDMIPPAVFAGLDLRGCGARTQSDYDTKACNWPGLSIEDAEKLPTLDPTTNTYEGANCQGNAGGSGGCGENQSDTCGNVSWGDNGEVNFSYDLATHLIDQLDIGTGYLGLMQFDAPLTSDPGCSNKPYATSPHHYKIQIGYPILRDDSVFEIDWGQSSTAIAELYDGIAKAFYKNAGSVWPGCYSPSAYGCEKNGTCLYNPNDGTGTGYFGIRPIATYLQFHSTLPQPAASVPFNMYIDYAKFVPNSTQNMTLAINTRGPYTDGVIPQSVAAACVQQIGQSFDDYVKNCIEPYDPTKYGQLNDTAYHKMIGGHVHNLEEITFNLVGINQNFALSSGRPDNTPIPNGTNLGTYGVVQDTDLPAKGDLSTEWYFDIRAFGSPSNEGTSEYATGLVAREFQRLAEIDLTRLYNAKHGTNLLPSKPYDCTFAADQTLATQLGIPTQPTNPGHLCTGLELMMLPGGGSPQIFNQAGCVLCDATPTAQNGMTGAGAWQDYGVAGSALKPGDHYLAFTENPTAFLGALGIATPTGGWAYGPWWDSTMSWVTRILGKGDILNLPQAAADRRYFFKWFGVALVKYLRNAGDVLEGRNTPAACLSTGESALTDPTCVNPDTVAGEPIDLETLFFDNEFSNQFDKVEYIDLTTIAGYAGNTTQPDPNKPYLQVPFDYEYGTDVRIANQRYSNWYKRLDREELALYEALSPKKSDPGASHANYGVNLTNMFGSSVLANAYVNASTGAAWTYECAAAVWANGAWQNDATFPNAATDCPGVFPNGPPSWLLDPRDPTGGTALMDKNGQQRLTEQTAGTYTNPNAKTAYATAADGVPHTLLWQYPAVWGSTVFSQGHSAIQVCPPGATDCSDPAQPTSKTDIALEAAQSVIPSFTNPWAACVQSNPGTKNASGCDPTDPAYLSRNIYAFVPWLPAQPGVGFTIPTNGQSNLFVETSQLDFTGNLETYTVMYVPYQDKVQTSCSYSGGTDAGIGSGPCRDGYKCVSGTCVAKDNTIEIRAIEAHDFLGEVFVCEDPTTQDVLHVGMYTPTSDILEWLANHPGDPAGQGSAQSSCNIIVRYSPFNNYPDYITSLSNGVTLATNQGMGFGRIVDATLFNTVYETITQ